MTMLVTQSRGTHSCTNAAGRLREIGARQQVLSTEAQQLRDCVFREALCTQRSTAEGCEI